jgi:hypothetical protein
MGLAVALLGACGDSWPASPDATVSPYVEVLLAHVPNRNVDILFVLDNSANTSGPAQVARDFAAFVDELGALPAGLPDLHLGVITSDLGTSSADDQAPGPSLGGCTGVGQAGQLQVNGAPVVGRYLSDVANPDGTRTTNYAGQLAPTFAQMAAVGPYGCGFEQPLEAARRALDGASANAGFSRPNAALAVIFVGNEDDCSIAHERLLGDDAAALGPLQSFRCTRFGITCDQGGATSDEMNQVGAKGACHASASDAYLTDLDRYASFFQGLVLDPQRLMLGAIVGDPAPVEVELRAPPEGGAPIPALAPSCRFVDAQGETRTADPAVRIAQLVGDFAHHAIASVCSDDLSPALRTMARQIGQIATDACVARDIALPADCQAFDETNGFASRLPACGAAATDCFEVVTDPVACPAGQHQRLSVRRSAPTAPRTLTSLRCQL